MPLSLEEMREMEEFWGDPKEWFAHPELDEIVDGAVSRLIKDREKLK